MSSLIVGYGVFVIVAGWSGFAWRAKRLSVSPIDGRWVHTGSNLHDTWSVAMKFRRQVNRSSYQLLVSADQLELSLKAVQEGATQYGWFFPQWSLSRMDILSISTTSVEMFSGVSQSPVIVIRYQRSSRTGELIVAPTGPLSVLAESLSRFGWSVD